MNIVRMVISILFIAVCVALTILILLQDGKDRPLSALTGSSFENSYLKRSKQMTKEKLLKRITIVLLVIFFVAVTVLNTNLI